MRSYLIMPVIFGIVTLLAFPGQSNGDVINACKNNHNGTLRVVDDASDCRGSESPLSWNTEGPQGDPGEQGPPGPAGGFDVTKLYVVKCYYSTDCHCDEEDLGGRYFISGTVECPMTDNETQSYLHLANYIESTGEFEAFCTHAEYTLGNSSYVPPESITLICYDNSE